MVSVNNLISSKVAIRSALGDMSAPNALFGNEPDFHRWVGEAMQQIDQKLLLRQKKGQFVVSNNKIMVCNNFKGIECIKIDGKIIPHVKNSPCNPPSENYITSCGCSAFSPNLIACCDEDSGRHTFYIQECFIKFKQSVSDGTIADVIYYEAALDDDGFMLMPIQAQIAVSEYILWKYKRKIRDNTSPEHKRLFDIEKFKANAKLREDFDEEMRRIGNMWGGCFYYDYRYEY